MHLKVIVLFIVLLFGSISCQDEPAAPDPADPAVDETSPDPVDEASPTDTSTSPSAVDDATTGDTVAPVPAVPEETTVSSAVDATDSTPDAAGSATDASAGVLDPGASSTAAAADAVTPGEETVPPAPLITDDAAASTSGPGEIDQTTGSPVVDPNTDSSPTDIPPVADNSTDPSLLFPVLSTFDPAAGGEEITTSTEDITTSTETSSTTSEEPLVVPVVVPPQSNMPLSPDPRPISLTSPGSATAAPARNVESEWSWRKGGLLVAGIILLIAIIIGYVYACCCIKDGPAARRFSRTDVEHGTLDTVPIVKPIDSLTKSNKYVDEMITNASYHYQETRRENTVAARKGDPATPNNSIIAPGEVSSVENQNSKYANKPGKPTALSIPIGTPINSPAAPVTGPTTHFKYASMPRSTDKSYVHTAPSPWDRRLDVPSGPITSRDVINASRVNNAVITVAAAGSAPLKITDGDRPVLRGGTLPGTPPIRSPTYRTTLLLTPVHNRDPNDPVLPPGEELSYRQYVEQVKGPNSDFAQYSPEYNRDLAELERRNAESQL
ncbi:mucin-5AC-like [Paramacrobiotus metropolitanus]|uniref:mucin-5AC-like n=1 Tax=Paramacrobiotus metropolitanus TaxID=2943436 RepID=UPI00244655BE|nr:mucin-5AC-like [Paramacrobiotus metropolitanus]